MKPSEILERADALLTPETWGKGVNCRGGVLAEGKLCAGMAIDKVSLGGSHRAKEYFCVATNFGITGLADISFWNDAPERTLAEVHARFVQAIENAKRAEE